MREPAGQGATGRVSLVFNELNTHLLTVPPLDSGDARTIRKTPGSTLTRLGVQWIDECHDDEQELGALLGKCDKDL